MRQLILLSQDNILLSSCIFPYNMREIIIFKVGWLLDSTQPLVRTKYATILLSIYVERVLQFMHVKRYTIYFDGN